MVDNSWQAIFASQLTTNTDIHVFQSKVNSYVRKIYILRPNRDQLRKMQLQDLRLGIEPACQGPVVQKAISLIQD